MRTSFNPSIEQLSPMHCADTYINGYHITGFSYNTTPACGAEPMRLHAPEKVRVGMVVAAVEDKLFTFGVDEEVAVADADGAVATGHRGLCSAWRHSDSSRGKEPAPR